jgi:hypothetical protein
MPHLAAGCTSGIAGRGPLVLHDIGRLAVRTPRGRLGNDRSRHDDLRRSDRSRAIGHRWAQLVRRAGLPVGAHPDEWMLLETLAGSGEADHSSIRDWGRVRSSPRGNPTFTRMNRTILRPRRPHSPQEMIDTTERTIEYFDSRARCRSANKSNMKAMKKMNDMKISSCSSFPFMAFMSALQSSDAQSAAEPFSLLCTAKPLESPTDRRNSTGGPLEESKNGSKREKKQSAHWKKGEVKEQSRSISLHHSVVPRTPGHARSGTTSSCWFTT